MPVVGAEVADAVEEPPVPLVPGVPLLPVPALPVPALPVPFLPVAEVTPVAGLVRCAVW